MRFKTATPRRRAAKMPYVDNEADHGGRHQVWRVARGQRVGSALVVVAWLALALGFTIGAGVAAGVLVIVWSVLPLVTLMAWRFSFVPYVTLTQTAAVVRNRIGMKTIPYGDIAWVRPGYYGTTIKTKSGSAVVAWAVQKPNWATWFNKQTRADELAAAIKQRMAAVSYGAHPEDRNAR